MLYTVVSEYDVFLSEAKPSLYESVAGGRVEYSIINSQRVVKSLFSTDPRMYLDKRYLPGARLSVKDRSGFTTREAKYGGK